MRSSGMDVVELKNGDRLSGRVVDMSEGRLKFSAHGNEAILLPWNEVNVLVTGSRLRFYLSGGGCLDGRIYTPGTGRFAIDTAIGPVEVKASDIASIDNFDAIARKEAERRKKEKFDLGSVWSGLVSIGVSDTSGNSDSKNLNLSAEATRKSPSDKLFLDAHYNRTSASGIVSADQVRGGMRLDVNISKRRFYFLFGRLEVDKIKGLDLRSTVGAGLGTVYYDHPRGHLDMGAGLTYVRDTFDSAPKESSRTFLYSLNWRRRLSAAMEFKERLLVYPNLEDFGDYRVEADTKFDFNIDEDLSFTLGVSNRFDTEPLAGREKHDMTITTSITKRY